MTCVLMLCRSTRPASISASRMRRLRSSRSGLLGAITTPRPPSATKSRVIASCRKRVSGISTTRPACSRSCTARLAPPGSEAARTVSRSRSSLWRRITSRCSVAIGARSMRRAKGEPASTARCCCRSPTSTTFAPAFSARWSSSLTWRPDKRPASSRIQSCGSLLRESGSLSAAAIVTLSMPPSFSTAAAVVVGAKPRTFQPASSAHPRTRDSILVLPVPALPSTATSRSGQVRMCCATRR
jgi:hypothetical protein